MCHCVKAESSTFCNLVILGNAQHLLGKTTVAALCCGIAIILDKFVGHYVYERGDSHY